MIFLSDVTMNDDILAEENLLNESFGVCLSPFLCLEGELQRSHTHTFPSMACIEQAFFLGKNCLPETTKRRRVLYRSERQCNVMV